MHKLFKNRETEIQPMKGSGQWPMWSEAERFIAYRPPYTHYHDSEKCMNFAINRASMLTYYIRCMKTNNQLYKMSLTPRLSYFNGVE